VEVAEAVAAGRLVEGLAGERQGQMRMSYDLAVFDPLVAPRGREAFLKWYREQEGIDTNSPDSVLSPNLRLWLDEMVAEFPPMNGPMAKEIDEHCDLEPEVSDYSIGPYLIYVCFSWTITEKAYKACLGKAQKHGAGFFGVSHTPGEIIFPDAQF
jgi:hypothetical protein